MFTCLSQFHEILTLMPCYNCMQKQVEGEFIMSPLDLVVVLGVSAFVIIVSLIMAMYMLKQSQSDN